MPAVPRRCSPGKSNVIREDLREAEIPSPRTLGRRRLGGAISGVAESLSLAKAETTNHRQNEHTALAACFNKNSLRKDAARSTGRVSISTVYDEVGSG